ncbi:MAG: ACT domain-containing protein [Armatimonadetes bacterium]|nr:ACT domain-containing protein [Armatimonadota bacterium]
MIEQLAVFSENKPGKLERITDALAEAGVNIRAMHVASLGEMGVVKMVVDRPEEAYEALRGHGTVRKVPVVAVRVPDRPGALHDVTAVLNEGSVNIENASGFPVSDREAILILEVADVEAAEKLLQAAEFHVVDEGGFERG